MLSETSQPLPAGSWLLVYLQIGVPGTLMTFGLEEQVVAALKVEKEECEGGSGPILQ